MELSIKRSSSHAKHRNGEAVTLALKGATFFAYPKDIRKMMYTTNAIESLNSVIRHAIKKHKVFPTVYTESCTGSALSELSGCPRGQPMGISFYWCLK